MGFFTPPSLKLKPVKNCGKNRQSLWEKNPVLFIRLASSCGMGLIFLFIGLIAVVLFWRVYENFGQSEFLASLTLALFFMLGFVLGTYSGRLVIYDLKKTEGRGQKII